MAEAPHSPAAGQEAAGDAVEHGVAHAAGAPAAGEGHAGATAEHKTEGLPQFDTAQWGGQAVWFLVIFGVVLLLMRTVFVPRIGGAIEAREARISGDIAEARRLKDEADAQAQAAATDTAKARAEAQKLALDARAKAQAEIAERMAAEEAKIAETMAAAEAGINARRDAAMANVREIAVDTASAIVGKLTGQPASPKEIEAVAAGRA